jgi:hypothetical protein
MLLKRRRKLLQNASRYVTMITRRGTFTYRGLQAVADAYYVLSDPTRRREYDSLYSTRSRREKESDPNASSANFFSQFASMFGGGASNAAGATPPGRPDADHVFGDVFEDVRRLLFYSSISADNVCDSFFAPRSSVMALGGPGPAVYAAPV